MMVAKMPLSVVNDGIECMVHSLRRCRDSSRLMEMGFVDKARIRVLSRSDSGIIANVNGTKLALSMELARQIIVTC